MARFVGKMTKAFAAEPFDAFHGIDPADKIAFSAGDDTVIVNAQLTGYGTLDGGLGFDTLQINRALAPVSANGGAGPYALSLALFNNPATTTLLSFERLSFNSLAGDQMNAVFAFGGNAGAVNQIGPGLAANSVINGGAGQDLLSLSWSSANLPGTVTAPSFTFTNWDTPTRAYLGDRVIISVSGNGATTVNGSAHIGVQGLNGGAGSDVINGSNDMDLISGGSAGADQMHGNGGDDTLFLINTYLINNGVPGAETTITGSGSLYDGGSGFDFMMFGGNVNFQGTLQDIEGLLLIPGFANPNIGGPSVFVSSQNYTTVVFSRSTFAALPANLLLAGVGTVAVNFGNGGESLNASGFTFDPGAAIAFDFTGGDGNDTIIGSSVDDQIGGGLGDDTLSGGAGNDVFVLNGGTDTATGGVGNDQFQINLAGTNNSNIDGGADSDNLQITANATMFGTFSNLESLTLFGGVQLVTSASNLANGFAVGSTITGSGGSLVAALSPTDTFFYANLFQTSGSFLFVVSGNVNDDVIKGATGEANLLIGNGGADQIRGGSLGDTIDGGDGNDKLMGALGRDTLTGGAGADTFRYPLATHSGTGANADVITDFTIGTDKLAFAQLDADLVAPGRQALTFIGTTAFHATGAAELHYGTSGADLLVQIDLDGNGTSDMEIVLQGLAGQTLTSGDFLL
jgi:Ca2+-binding RTX toxin-like protein